jgi:polar amino acid transport system substrate-binding protein
LIRPYLLAACFLLLLGQPSAAGGKLVISTQAIPPYSTDNGTGFYDTLYPEIGRRTGLEITVVQQPDRRSLQLTNSGINDGDGPRLPGLEKQFPDLIRVDEPILHAELVAFTRKGTRVNSWDDLANRFAAVPKGWQLPKDKIPVSMRLTTVISTHSSMAMLATGRIDAALTLPAMGRHEINKHGYWNITPEPAILDERLLYLYMHKKHAALVPAIDEAIKAIKADGTWERLFEQAIAQTDK